MRVPQRANQNSSKKWGPCVMSATTEPIGIHLRTEVRFLKDPPTERVQSRTLKSKFQFTRLRSELIKQCPLQVSCNFKNDKRSLKKNSAFDVIRTRAFQIALRLF